MDSYAPEETQIMKSHHTLNDGLLSAIKVVDKHIIFC